MLNSCLGPRCKVKRRSSVRASCHITRICCILVCCTQWSLSFFENQKISAFIFILLLIEIMSYCQRKWLVVHIKTLNMRNLEQWLNSHWTCIGAVRVPYKWFRAELDLRYTGTVTDGFNRHLLNGLSASSAVSHSVPSVLHWEKYLVEILYYVTLKMLFPYTCPSAKTVKFTFSVLNVIFWALWWVFYVTITTFTLHLVI